MKSKIAQSTTMRISYVLRASSTGDVNECIVSGLSAQAQTRPKRMLRECVWADGPPLSAILVLRLQRGIIDGRRVVAFCVALMACLAFRARALVGGVATASMAGH
jgi:hypothetical protein